MQIATEHVMLSSGRSYIKKLKQEASDIAGMGLVWLMPKRAQRIASDAFTLTNHHAASRLERLIRRGLAKSALKTQNSDQLAAYHRNFWAGEAGHEYHEIHRDKFEYVFVQHFAFILDDIRRLLAKNPDITTIVEIGAGSGQLLEHLTEQLPTIEQFIGLDLSPQTTEANRARYSNPKLSFETAEGVAWVVANARPNTLFVTFRGVLEYFPQPDLDKLLTHVAQQQPALFLTIEPTAWEHDVEKQLDSVPYGNEFTFSHNYPERFRQAGYKLEHVSFQRLYHDKEYCVLASAGLK